MASPDGACCPLCGSAMGEAACSSCPLSSGCALVCCPTCGYSTVVAGESRLVRWVLHLLRGQQIEAGPLLCLADARPNSVVRVLDLDELHASDQERLRAYGILPGCTLHIIQQRPVTVGLVEQGEVALEPVLARSVRVAMTSDQ
jgi:Fe2+ transport system protein FeoA